MVAVVTFHLGSNSGVSRPMVVLTYDPHGPRVGSMKNSMNPTCENCNRQFNHTSTVAPNFTGGHPL
jgi:hypothetical protein